MHKVTAEVPDEVFEEMHNVVPWGLRKHLIASVMRLVVAIIKQEGIVAAGAILDGKFKIVRDEDA